LELKEFLPNFGKIGEILVKLEEILKIFLPKLGRLKKSLEEMRLTSGKFPQIGEIW
jgi:hypothetical protein